MKINILGYEWELEIQDDKLFSNFSGICNYENHTICISTKSLNMFSDTLHEIAHAHIHIAGTPIPNELEEFCILFQTIIDRLVDLNGDDVLMVIRKWCDNGGEDA